MPAGRQPGWKKKFTIEQFFNTFQGSVLWRRGNNLFDQFYGQNIIPNGFHNVQLIGGRFEVPQKGKPCHVFTFEFEDGRKCEKIIPFDLPENIAMLLRDLKVLGFTLSNWNMLNDIYGKIAINRPRVTIEARMAGEIQYIHLCNARESVVEWPQTPQDKQAPAPAIEVVQVPEVAPEPKIEAIPVIPEPIAEPETEILAGDTIRAKYRGAIVVGNVLMELPEEMELLIQSDGKRLIINAGDVLAKL